MIHQMEKAARGNRRFGVTVLTFAIVNAGVWAAYHHWAQPSRRDVLRVERFVFQEGRDGDGRPLLLWTFNLDVARPEARRQFGDLEQPGHAPGEIRPAVAGRWRWVDGRTLCFAPAEPLPKATKFAVSLRPERLRTAEGFTLSKAYEGEIRTAALRVTGVRQIGLLEGDRYVLEVEFSDRVLPAEVLGHLSVRRPDGKPLGVRLHGQAPDHAVCVVTDSLSHERNGRDEEYVQLDIRPGLTGTSGPLGLEEAFSQKVTLERQIGFTGIDASSPASGQPSIRLRANHAVAVDVARRVISVEPAVPFVLGDGYSGVCLTGDFQPGERYAVKIAPPPAGADPRLYPRPGVLSATVPDRERGVWFEHESGYLGALGNRVVLAHAVNVPKVKLRVWRLYENNLVAWQNASERRPWQGLYAFSRPVAARSIALGREKNRVQDLRIDLNEVLGGRHGLLEDGVYRLTLDAAPEGDAAGTGDGEPDAEEQYGEWGGGAAAVVTLSDIGITAKLGRDSLAAWAVSLSRGAPMAGVRVRVYSNKGQLLGEGRTGDDGVVSIGGLRPAEGEQASLVLADSSGGDGAAAGGPKGLTWLNLRAGRWSQADQDVGGRPYLRGGYEAFVFTERGVYRPGETLHLRGIVRDRRLRSPEPFPVQWQLRRPDHQDWRAQTLLLDRDGAAGFDADLPRDLPTGEWTAELRVPGGSGGPAIVLGSVSFFVEEFMPQRLKAELTFRGDSAVGARWTLGDRPLNAAVRADWLFGRPAAGLQAKLTGRLDPVTFSSPHWSGWTFGDAARVRPAPHKQRELGKVLFQRAGQEADTALRLDEQGRGQWALPIAEMLGPAGGGDAGQADDGQNPDEARRNSHAGPWRLSASVEVQENGWRAVTVRREMFFDTAPWYLAVRPQLDGAMRPNEPAIVALALVSPVSGELAAADAVVRLSVSRESWNNTLVHRDGRYHYESHRTLEAVAGAVAEKARVTGGRAEVPVSVPGSGSYVLEASDDAGRLLASVQLYASDGLPWEDSVGREQPERLELTILGEDAREPATRPAGEKADESAASVEIAKADIPRRFKVGERARVLVRSPFAGRLLLTVETDGVVFSKVVEMSASAVEIPVEITAAMEPNAYVTASVVRAIRPNAKWRAHRACGSIRLLTEPVEQRVNVAIEARGEVRPDSDLEVTVVAKDHGGNPVTGGAVTVMAVDEGILQWTQFRSPDPLRFFWAERALQVASGDVYGQLMPEVPSLDNAGAIGGDGSREARHLSVVSAKRVNSVAIVSPVLHTDDRGRAVVRFHVPAFSGTLRLMAVAHTATALGAADRTMLVRAPLLVEGSFPRFLAPGDRFAAPLTIFNNGEHGGSVRVSIDLKSGADGLLKAQGRDGPQWTLAPFDLPAAGQHRLEVPLEAAAAAGVAKVRVRAEMGDERAEETIELAVRPAAPVLTRGGYAAAGPGEPAKLQIPGGFMPGTGRMEISVTPWPTLRISDALSYLDQYPHGCAEQTISTCMPLVHLDRLGAQIAPDLFERQRVGDKLQSGILRLMGMQTADGGLGMWPGAGESWPWASVYGAHLLVAAERAGHPVPDGFRNHLLSYTRKLLDRSAGENDDLLEAQAYACYVLALARRADRGAMSRLDEATRSNQGDADTDAPARRTQARLHLALAWVAAGRPDLAKGLIPDSPLPTRSARQSGGNIGSAVRDRAMLLSARLAVDPQDPALPALAQQLADTAVEGRWGSTQDCAFASLALGEYLAGAGRDAVPYSSAELRRGVEVVRTGRDGSAIRWRDSSTASADYSVFVTGPAQTRAHVSWLLSGVPLAPPADADAGMKVRRRYLDAEGRPLKDGHVESGELVSVELTVEAPAMQQNIVIEDLLPAGLEIENPRLAGGQGEEPVGNSARLDVRDDRLVLVTSMPEAGVAKFRYAVRAVTPGTYVVPPVRAECMYDIAMNSISGGGATLVVRPVVPGAP